MDLQDRLKSFAPRQARWDLGWESEERDVRTDYAFPTHNSNVGWKLLYSKGNKSKRWINLGFSHLYSSFPRSNGTQTMSAGEIENWELSVSMNLFVLDSFYFSKAYLVSSSLLQKDDKCWLWILGWISTIYGAGCPEVHFCLDGHIDFSNKSYL